MNGEHKQHPKDFRTCTCGSRFRYQRDLDLHIQLGNASSAIPLARALWECTWCGGRTETITNLEKHWKSAHNQSVKIDHAGFEVRS